MSYQIPTSRQRTYYRHCGITVAGTIFMSHRKCYDIRQITNLMRSRSGPHPGVVVSATIAVCESVLAATFAPAAPTPVTLVALSLMFAVPCIAALICAFRWPRALELIAQYHGSTVMIFATHDKDEFGKVCRALQRAIEAVDTRTVGHGSAL